MARKQLPRCPSCSKPIRRKDGQCAACGWVPGQCPQCEGIGCELCQGFARIAKPLKLTSPPQSPTKPPKGATRSKGKSSAGGRDRAPTDQQGSPKPDKGQSLPSRKRGRGRPTDRTHKEGGQAVRNTSREWQIKASKATRDIAPAVWSDGTSIWEAIDWERRIKCKHDPEAFGMNYMPRVFYLPSGNDHLRCIRKMKTVFLEGGKFSLAMPRGQGKTAWCRCGMLWGTAYAHKRFLFFIGSTQGKAAQTLDFLKMYWFSSKPLRQDFPELGYAIWRLENRWHLASGQTYHGNPTHVEWSADSVRYPSLLLNEEEAAPYLQHDAESIVWHEDHQAFIPKSAGIVVRTAGIDGSIRGEAEIHPITLEQPRPDVILLDDIQKDQKAESPASCEKLIRLIDGAIEGLGGPDELIAALMPCTVIKEGDVSDTYLDRSKKPEWKGERCAMVTSWPEGIDDYTISADTEEGAHWEKYAELRKESLRVHEDIRLATTYYVEHQEIMDRGFTVSWESRFNSKLEYEGNREVSAQQHAMNLRLTAPLTFPAEYQNNPKDITADHVVMITPAELAERIIPGLQRGHTPADAVHCVGFIDVQNEGFFYLIAAADLKFTGAFVEYGTWPFIGTRYFRKAQMEGWNYLSKEFFKAYPEHKSKGLTVAGNKLRAPLEAKLYFGLKKITQFLLSREFPKADHLGTIMRISKLGIDTRWGKAADVIKRFIRDQGRAELMPCYGSGITPAHKQFEEYQRTKGWLFEDQQHPTVKEAKWIWKPGTDGHYTLEMDVNRLKTFLMTRLASPMGTPGSFALHEGTPEQHEMFSDHVADSETPDTQTGRGRQKDMWLPKDGRPDNDWLDCAAGVMALLSFAGCRILAAEGGNEQAPTMATAKGRRKLSDMHEAKRKGRR